MRYLTIDNFLAHAKDAVVTEVKVTHREYEEVSYTNYDTYENEIYFTSYASGTCEIQITDTFWALRDPLTSSFVFSWCAQGGTESREAAYDFDITYDEQDLTFDADFEVLDVYGEVFSVQDLSWFVDHFLKTVAWKHEVRKVLLGPVETNVRNSGSELNTQPPIIDFANRIIDILGSDTAVFLES